MEHGNYFNFEIKIHANRYFVQFSRLAHVLDRTKDFLNSKVFDNKDGAREFVNIVQWRLREKFGSLKKEWPDIKNEIQNILTLRVQDIVSEYEKESGKKIKYLIKFKQL